MFGRDDRRPVPASEDDDRYHYEGESAELGEGSHLG
jgi:hypothetical protein